MAIINNSESSKIKKLCNPCIESKYTKIFKHIKITRTTKKLQKIHTNLLKP